MVHSIGGRIRKLPPLLVSQIAAGEVIERPASVVKELVENSIDAGATRIEIVLESGGKQRIQVTDDGLGIAEEDLELALASHATSKLTEDDGLQRVVSLGFRGEALASIASVAEVELCSRPPLQDVASRVIASEGRVEAAAPLPLPHGTRVIVRDLFFTVPARRRFLKSDSAEVARTSSAIKSIAMALPTVGFRLLHDDRVVLDYPADQRHRDRIAEILGSDLGADLIELPSTDGVWGWLGRPEEHRRNNDGIWSFLNGRPIRDRQVQHAVREGYRGFQIPGHYPVALIFLDIDPSEVDVNVHPTKHEVRFRDSQGIHRRIRRAIREALTAEGSVPQLPVGTVAEPAAGLSPRPVREMHADQAGEPPPVGWSREVAKEKVVPEAIGSTLVEEKQVRVFQVRNSFLVIEEEEGLRVIDQHALHEKILYEEILRQREEGGARQGLLVPEPVRLDPSEWTSFCECQEALAEVGLEVEEFGEDTVLVRSVPAGFEEAGIPALLRSLLQRVQDSARGGDVPDLRERLLQTLACKAAVKAGQRLSPEAQEDLVRGRDRAFQPQNCPHGRPSELFITWQELERSFDRK
ncbi:MAG TPA: DNA mismatch repair endonuclease MutL [Planctomycetes bacterium]|nr:DNA mismatch repair endonuclease MutL [Planctomycetota bacterium]